MKLYRVSYYQWYFDRYGDKDFEFIEGWVGHASLVGLQNDSHVDELEIHEETEID